MGDSCPRGGRGWVGVSRAARAPCPWGQGKRGWGLHVSLAALAFPLSPLPQPEGKHGSDLLGSRLALGR